MRDDPEAERLEALRRRLRAREQASRPHHMESSHSQAQMAWRMVIELVAGLGIGAAMGYGLDWLLGSSPWLLIVFTFLGFAAGVKTVISSGKEMQKAYEARAEAPPQDEDR